MSATVEEVRWIAQLARLELSAAEEEGLARDLGAILHYINQLQALNTEAIEPLAHPLDVQNVVRADVPGESLPVDAVLANAPARRDNFYAVPAVLD